MSYSNCRQGRCEDCNGYIGPLDTYACLHACHDREPDASSRDDDKPLRDLLAERLYQADGGEGEGHPVLAQAAQQRYRRLADAAIELLNTERTR